MAEFMPENINHGRPIPGPEVTREQMLAAPKNAYYICPSLDLVSRYEYAAKSLKREDLRIRTPDFCQSEFFRHGKFKEEVIIDCQVSRPIVF